MSEQAAIIQDRETFEKRRSEFAKDFGAYAGFVLAAVLGAMEKVKSLGKEAGRQVVATRQGDYRPYDPEIIKVDEVAEGYFLARIEESGFDAVIISEEAGRVISKGGNKERVYFVSDPFDGSLLYKRGIPAFWYTTLAIYSAEGKPLACAVCDIPNENVDFANEEAAYHAKFREGRLFEVARSKPADTTELTEAVLETYMMKVPRLYPASEVWKPLISQVKFVLPNGGPCGYADVAKGTVDIYLALEEAHIENFSALPIAWRAGAIVTDFEGNEVRFEDKKDKRYFIACSATEALHTKLLKEISKISWQEVPHYNQILKENLKI